MGKLTAGDREVLARQLEVNLWQTWSVFGRGPGSTLHDDDDALWFDTPVPIIPYNGVLRFHGQSSVDDRIAGFVDHFHRRNAHFMWILHPSSSPADLSQRLLAHGLKDVEPIPGMGRRLDDLPLIPPLPSGIQVRKVASESDASAFYQFAAWRWNVPEELQEPYKALVRAFRFGEPGSNAHMWQAWREGQPVAKAGLHFASESAGIYAVVTRPEARGLGLASTLTLTALHHARASGYSLAVLHSTPMAEGLYRSLGFENIAQFRLFGSDNATF
jgi:GNAT superfamily N-acetyltransferase